MSTHNEDEERPRRIDPVSCCAHSVVKYDPIDNGNGMFTTRWRCSDCTKEFIPMPKIDFPGAVMVPMPEMATLRDQFAMAALQGRLAAGYMPDHNRLREAAVNMYQMADAMWEAREK